MRTKTTTSSRPSAGSASGASAKPNPWNGPLQTVTAGEAVRYRLPSTTSQSGVFRRPIARHAALAAGMSKPFDKDHDLRIGAPAPTAADGWARQDAGPAGNGSGATLRGPVPLAEAGSQPDARQPALAAVPPQTAPGPATQPAAQGSRLASLDQLEAQVKARGALWHRLDKIGDTGEYKFSCSVPNRRKPGSRRTYEARAKDALVAVQAVLDQIDKDQ